MFKLSKKFLLLPVILLIAALLPSQVKAAQFHTGDFTLDKASILEEDLYVTGDNVTVNGTVNGDAILSGNNITVDGTVTGDLYVFGNMIKVSGNVDGNVIAAGQEITLEGAFGSNVYIGGMTVDISSNIDKDLMVASWTTNLSGNVGDDVRIGSGNMSSDAMVGGDFLVGSENYTVDQKDIAGELVIQAPKEKVEKPVVNIETIKEKLLGVNVAMTLVGFIGMLLVGASMIYLAPVKTLQFEKKITSSWEDFIKSFAIGLLVLFGLPLPLLVLTFTLVGAPLALLITGVLGFLVTFGTIWAEIAIGNKVLGLMDKQDNKRYLSLVLGRLITVMVKIVPILRGFYSLVLACVTVGAVVRSKTEALNRK